MEKYVVYNPKYFKNLVRNSNKLLPLNYKHHQKYLPLSLITGSNSFFIKKKLSKVSLNYLDNSTKLKEVKKSNSNTKNGNSSMNTNNNISSNNNLTNNSSINYNLNLLSINEYKKKRKISLNNIPIFINNNTFNIYNKYLNINFVTGRNSNQGFLHNKSKTNINSPNSVFKMNYSNSIKVSHIPKVLEKTRNSSHTQTLNEKRKQIKKPKSFFYNNVHNPHRNTQSEGNIHINLKSIFDNPNNANSDIIIKNITITRKIKEAILNKKTKSVSNKDCNSIKNGGINKNSKRQNNKTKTKSLNFINDKKIDNNYLSTSRLFLKKHKSTKSIKVQVKNGINTSRNTIKQMNINKKNDLILKRVKRIPTNPTKLNIKNKKIVEGSIEDILYNEEKNYNGKVDDFDDLNSIIKKMNFEKSNIKNLDIFNVDEAEKSTFNLRDTYKNQFDFIFKKYINEINNKDEKNGKNNKNKKSRNRSLNDKKGSIKTNPFSKKNETSK